MSDSVQITNCVRPRSLRDIVRRFIATPQAQITQLPRMAVLYG
jgi:hypothetical protein